MKARKYKLIQIEQDESSLPTSSAKAAREGSPSRLYHYPCRWPEDDRVRVRGCSPPGAIVSTHGDVMPAKIGTESERFLAVSTKRVQTYILSFADVDPNQPMSWAAGRLLFLWGAKTDRMGDIIEGRGEV